ncbi:hypothetical protein K1T71_012934 [Dendrolimus kikuchii]|uniref:Uncharacterized protein n=1 Tax=Dendrolimus kikuchii TaxID=765133 RepID=A0ACC1CIV8_9NEOP|nr:hypothetical protein K1T71_012934 [Dendrolimus kikuchii]
MVYVHNTATCICTNEGSWPHDQCKNILKSLPPGNTKKELCQPMSYITIDCNVCYCNAKGRIDSNRCTRNICENEIRTKGRRSGTSSVYGSCTIKNWYSLAPCQFCYCIHENKLVCNTGNNYEKLELGTYNLNVCGKDLIKEALELMPNAKGLRYGESTTTKPLKEATTIPSVHGNSIAINVNREQKEFNDAENDEFDSTEEEELQQNDKIVTTTIKNIARKGVTRMPYDNDDDDTNDENDFAYDRKDDDGESGVELEVPVETPSFPSKIRSSVLNNIKPKTGASIDSLQTLQQHLQNTMSLNFPKVIDKVFKMAMRKAMIMVDEPCEPGSVKVLDECNICFCMKNNKSLCTNDKCIL